VAATPTAFPIYAHNPDIPLVPASNQKLVTAFAALNLFGPDYKFKTVLSTDSRVTNGVVEGDVWLIGGGDPGLATPAYAASFLHQPQTFTDLNALVSALKGAGVTRIRGALIGDGSRYDDKLYVDAWPSRFTTGRGENPSGPLSALNVDDGFISYPPAGQEFGGSGTRVASPTPPLMAAQRVNELLRAAGISVDGGTKAGKAPTATTPVAAVDSAPLAQIVHHMLRESDNTTAELLVKEMGLAKAGKGTTADGLTAVNQVLAQQGLALPGVSVVDGSGLADTNKVTCTFLTRLLAFGGHDGVIGQGLSVAGTSGTLTDRFVGTPSAGKISAKTGTLSGVASLSGWADARPGTRVVFAIVANGGDEEALKSVEDQMATAMLTYPQGPTVDQLGPKPPPGH
jgi:D-alanyl-D-alanine carboxypeptidase/D-alanyl-D-alanine-endopeptidase (penicillin-binding protein 4)